MWIYVVYSQGPETLHNGTPKMYVTFFTPWGGKTVVIMQLLNVWEHQVDGQGGFTDGFNQQSLGCLPLDWHGGINASPKPFHWHRWECIYGI